MIFISPFFTPCFRTLKHSINRSSMAVVEHFMLDGLKCIDVVVGEIRVDNVETDDEQL